MREEWECQNECGWVYNPGMRESLGLTQEDLSLGICTQSQLSRIEKGGSIPSVEITFQLAQRLIIDLDEVFQMAENPKKEEVMSAFNEIRKAVQNRDYSQVEKILKGIRNNPLFLKIREGQFIICHEGIIAYYLYNQKDKSLQLLRRKLSR
ncbi:helix-turn-helix domain-containing protein [Microaerobacter geothermalis]|nr:helix-turn-helix domain-containing protein [Microaerobacter geothermalis]